MLLDCQFVYVNLMHIKSVHIKSVHIKSVHIKCVIGSNHYSSAVFTF